ncbi:zinc-binding alcohol dehydrogenase family protein [Salinibacterium sp. PAMC 21357]|uniref:zinc-binding alcohol dehydrogenase family protein n=1 Tax=Salinibacterium sp. PAMC 21357 TaxID=1112215 RepID=UPI00047504CA|nr:zinc-binding alcohol dehydrogenase family protein [Salinibacterium sp. PAMC 21357]
MTDTMNAVAYSHALPIDDPTSLEDVTLPVPAVGPHDLLVKVVAVSVNPADVKVRSDMDPGGMPTVLGFDAAGTVTAVGSDVTLYAVGDEVYYAGAMGRSGSNAELQAVDERIVGTKPKSATFAEAAALPLTTLTAWEGLFDKLKLTAESTGTLLIVGGAGGVGSMVIQLLKARTPGIRIIASAGREASQEWVRGLGADDVVRHGDHLVADTQAVAPEGVDYIFSTNSVGQVERYVELLNPFGEIVATDNPGLIDLGMFSGKALSWHAELMFTRPTFGRADMVEQHNILTEVGRMIDAGTATSTATTTFGPINAEQLRLAHASVETGRTLGKVVVTNEPLAS